MMAASYAREEDSRPEISNVTKAIASASGHGTNIVNISDSHLHVGPNITSSAMQFDDEIDWEDEDVKRHINGFIRAHNIKTDKRTQDKVTATFTNLKTPKKQVNPRFIDADYYRGKTSVKSEEYVPDSLYEGRGRRSIDGKPIELCQTLDGINYAAFIADAGAGKTTTAKRFAQMVLKKQIPSLEHIKLVRYVTLATLDATEKSTAYHLLFTNGMGDELTEGMKKYGYYWVKKHSHEILLVLDGLDQVNWVLDKNLKKDIAYEKEDLPSVIFYNILHKNVLKNCKIVMTSREHTMLNIPEGIRPQRTITLNGLSEKDQEYLILELAGERGKDILHHLRTNALYVMSLCQTPAFLVFSVAVYEDNSDNLPETLSEVLIRVLGYFILSENRRESSMGFGTFEKLKQLAYKGTSERRVIFTCKEIQELGLDTEKVRDLIITTPHKSAKGMFHLMEGQVNLFFCHQSIQEALCALHIRDMKMEEFKEFISHHLCKPHYSIVRRILVGVLLNPGMNHIDIEPVLGTVKEEKRKSSMIYDWLKGLASACHGGSSITQLFKPRYSYAELGKPDFELCTLLQECGDSSDDIIKQHIPSLKDRNAPMEIGNMFVFISMLSQCNELITDKVTVAPANSSEMKLFADCLTKIQHVEIDILEVARRGQNKIGGRRQQSSSQHTTEHQSSDKKIKVLDLDGNNDSDNSMDLYNDYLDFEFDNYDDLEPDGFRYIGEIIKQCKVEEVKLWSCNLSADKVSKLQEGIDDYSGKPPHMYPGTCISIKQQPEQRSTPVLKSSVHLKKQQPQQSSLSSLEYDRRELNLEMIEDIRTALSQCSSVLRLTSCTFPPEMITKFAKEILKTQQKGQKLKLKSLILRHNKGIGSEGFEAFGSLVAMCESVREIDITNCNLNSKGLKKFSAKVRNCVRVDKLSLDLNDGIANKSGMNSVAEIIQHCHVKNLSLSGCCIDSENLTTLRQMAKQADSKVEELCLDQNVNIYPKQLIDLSKTWRVRTLVLIGCEFNDDEKHEINSLPDTDIKYYKT